MLRLIRTEVMKLKGSYMVLIGIAGSAVVPGLAFMASVSNAARGYGALELEPFFSRSLLFDILLVGIMLYGLIVSYVFNREFQEDTMKSLLPVPVGRIPLLCAKLVVVLLWMEILMLFTVAFILVLAFLGRFTGISVELVVKYTWRFLGSGVFLLVLSTPVIFIALMFRSYVPAIAFTIMVTISSLFIGESDYAAFFPWTAAAGIVLVDLYETPYPIWVSWLTVSAVAVISLAASFILFLRRDVQ